jgi:hypothetical protein
MHEISHAMDEISHEKLWRNFAVQFALPKSIATGKDLGAGEMREHPKSEGDS